MFARRPGQRNDIPPIAMGSHLDTQPTGGKFDGVLGVLGALEALRTLVQAGYETFAPIEVINWTNEEGSRFAPAMVASGVFAGAFTRDWAWAREDRAGMTFRSALEDIGYLGRAALWSARAFGLLRTAYRAGADPGGRGQGDRHRHRRAGHALVRGDGDRRIRAHRRDADAAAQECAARCGAARRAHQCDRGTPQAGCARCGRADGGAAELAQRRAGRGVLLRRPAPSRRRDARHARSRVHGFSAARSAILSGSR